MNDIPTTLNHPILVHDLEALCIRIMLRVGLKEEHAQLTAKVLVTTDSWGIHTHGTKQLRGLMRNFKANRLSVSAEPELISEGSAWGLVDGHNAMPIVTSYRAMQVAIDKARNVGVAFVGVNHSSHFGAAGYYANMAAEKDMIGIAMSNVEPFMTVPGAKGRVLGTNPIAFAVPAKKHPTILLDIATSAVAVSKIFAARSFGNPIPESWMVDELGLPTTDPTKIDRGALQPMAGHKGYGLALLVEVLSAALTGSAMLSSVQSWALDLPNPSNQGHAFIVVNPVVFLPIDAFKERVDAIADEIKSAPKAQGSEHIYLPGEIEWEKRSKALNEGIQLPADVIESLHGLALDLGMG
jgi:ureidoglycolate dehydrogenase (NAD+)